ncbi:MULTISPECIES: hypothetical protein [Salinibaculum]|uniref:hypothetical protein n=1 Tax=Salinibaculum TaxID=2732368 RepID=UPI0030D568AC
MVSERRHPPERSRRPRDRLRRRLLSLAAGLVAVATVPATALAHTGHARGISTLPLAVFGVSVLMLLTGFYLDSRADVGDAYGLAGVFLGIAGLLAAIGLFLF